MSAASDEDLGRIALLEAIRREGEEWDVIAPRYGVTNPDPPWKTSLIAMCECLSVNGTLPTRTGAELRMRLQIPSMARCLLQKVSYSHSFIPCSTAGSWPREISPPACVPFDRGLKRLKAAVQVD